MFVACKSKTMKYWKLIFLAFISCGEISSNKIDAVRTDSLKNWLVYGMLESNMDAKNCVAKEYGFKYKPIAGCVINQSVIDSAEIENVKLKKMLCVKYGENWKELFNRKVDILETKFQELNLLLKDYIPFNERSQQFKQKGYHLITEIMPSDTSYEIFNICLYYFDEKEVKPYLIKDKMFEINLTKKLIIEKGIQ